MLLIVQVHSRYILYKFGAIMDKKVIMVLIVNIIISISIYQLIGLLNLPNKQLDTTSKLRFLCFVGLHAMVFLSMLILLKIQGTYSYIVLIFINCTLAVLAITVCQFMVKQIQLGKKYNFKKNDGSSQSLQLTYLNIYFLTYMYCIIGFFITGIFLIVTQVLICLEQNKINQGVNHCLNPVLWNVTMEDVECPICLENMRAGQKYVEVKVCKHMFHKRCLVQWIIHNKTCPLCRIYIFQEDNPMRSAPL